LSCLEELPVDRDVPGAGDLASREDAVRPDEQLGAAPERDRAVLEEALDLDGRALVEGERRVAEDVTATEVAMVRRARRVSVARRLELAGEDRRDLRRGDAHRTVRVR